MTIVFARSTTIQAHPSFIDEGIKHVRDVVMPALTEVEGCLGLSLLVDRDSGRCIATSSWRDEESLRSSEGPVQKLRDEATKTFHGTAEVSRWEIAAMHRDHPSDRGAYCRVTWAKVGPGHMDRVIDVGKLAGIPKVEELEGFCSASLLVDRATGRAVSSLTYDSREAMERNVERMKEIRVASLGEVNAEVLETGEFELVIAHLHVPEMA
ncbi:antibiotic biosynthesis monooxygenase [Rhodococcus sp. NPDC049939]|uniref:antibiotic biosynthesis monooxygenase n=1 Tax=Rhodococcus sp. NPDC049939 TaxID=3155511 RepID=UPI0033EF1BB4